MKRTFPVWTVCMLAAFAAGCTQSDTNKATQQANKTLQDVTKAAQSVATSGPMLAASDTLLAIAVKARLAAADLNSTTGIGVTARDGTVTLGGTVRGKSEIPILRSAAHSVNGVKAVHTDLRVDRNKPTATDQANDLALAARVMAGIASQTGLNALGVRVAAKNGVVTLEGSARNKDIKNTTLEAVRKTPGVRSVVDRLKAS